MKKGLVVAALILLALFSMLSVFYAFGYYKGYYPLPYILRKLYYVTLAEKTRLTPVVLDEKFKFSKRGYSVESRVDSPYTLSHDLILKWPSDQEKVPVDHKFSGSIKVDIVRDGKTVFSQIVNTASNLYKYNSEGNRVCTRGFILCQIPFPLEGQSYKNIKIKVLVLEPEKKLLEYVDMAKLVLFPNLSL